MPHNTHALLYLLGAIDETKLFAEMFSPAALQDVFSEKFARSTSKSLHRALWPFTGSQYDFTTPTSIGDDPAIVKGSTWLG